MSEEEELSMFCAITANNGERVPLKISKSVTPTELRREVSKATKIPPILLRLIFRGKMIKDDNSKNAVQEYALKEGEVLHCMGKPNDAGVTLPSRPSPLLSQVSGTPPTSAPAPAPAQSNGPRVFPTQPSPLLAAGGAAPPAASEENSLQAALTKLRTANPPATYLTAIQTLEKILNNIANNPNEEKYRRMKKSNGTFQKRLGGVSGGADALLACGFTSEMQEGEDCFVLQPSADAWPKLIASKTAVAAAAQQAKAVNNNNAAAPFAPAAVPPMMGAGGGMPSGFGGSLPPGMNTPHMQQAMRSMMSNPEQLRAMLLNPMVQQMMQNDPRTPPHMRQMMAELANNPEALNQVSAMMANPQMQAMMEQQMNSSAGGMGGGMGMPGMMNMPQANNNNNGSTGTNATGNNSSSNNQGEDDTTQTEEEMIAEAIRRSLQE